MISTVRLGAKPDANSRTEYSRTSKTARALRDEGPAAEVVAALCGLAVAATVPLPRSPLTGSACAVFRKVAPTPAYLPRREGLAVRKPLTG